MNSIKKNAFDCYRLSAVRKLSARLLVGFATAAMALLWLLVTTMIAVNESELTRQIVTNWAIATPLVLPILRCAWAFAISGGLPARLALFRSSGPWAFAFAEAIVFAVSPFVPVCIANGGPSSPVHRHVL